MEETAETYARPLVELLGSVDAFFDRKLRPEQKAPTYIDWRAKRLKELIDTDPSQGHRNLADLCKQLGLSMSSRQARRLFKLATGVGIRDYAKNRRLSVAIEQLKVMNTPVKAIAAELGFQNPRQFRRHFKDFFGLSPLEFRKLSGQSECGLARKPAMERCA